MYTCDNKQKKHTCIKNSIKLHSYVQQNILIKYYSPVPSHRSAHQTMCNQQIYQAKVLFLYSACVKWWNVDYVKPLNDNFSQQMLVCLRSVVSSHLFSLCITKIIVYKHVITFNRLYAIVQTTSSFVNRSVIFVICIEPVLRNSILHIHVCLHLT